MIDDVVEQAKAQIAKEQRDELDRKKEQVKLAAIQMLKNIEVWKDQITSIQSTIQMTEKSLMEMSADPIKYFDANLVAVTTKSTKPFTAKRCNTCNKHRCICDEDFL